MDIQNTAISGELKRSYEIGDACWIHLGGSAENGLTEGKVVHIFTPPGWSIAQYVIEIPTSIDPLLKVRSASAMSQDAEGPILLFRSMRKRARAMAGATTKWVLVMADDTSTGLWNENGRGMSVSSLPISDSLRAQLRAWVEWYEKNELHLPEEMRVNEPFPWRDFVVQGLAIAKAIKVELPDWNVSYYDEETKQTLEIKDPNV